MSKEKKMIVWGLVKAYETGKPDSLVTVLPKPLREALGLKPGDRFLVKTAENEPGTIILDRISIKPGGKVVW